MTAEASSGGGRVVQHYRPKGLETADHVSVSGLDLSRDRQELLVSYESDQIYTFPVFSSLKSAAGPTLDDLGHSRENGISDNVRERSSGNKNRTTKVLNELAAYGGHLNRFTFLKVCLTANMSKDFCFSPHTHGFRLLSIILRMRNMLALMTNTFALGQTLVMHGFMKSRQAALSLY